MIRLARWALYSQARLIALLAWSLVALIVTSLTMALLFSGAAADQEKEPDAAAVPPGVAQQVVVSDEEAARLIETTETFLAAFLDTDDMDRDAWFDQVRPLVDSTMAPQLYSTDLASLPRGRVREVAVDEVYDGTALTRIRVGKETGTVGLVERDGKWLVNSIMGGHDR